MADEAKRDQNFVTTLLAASSVDGISPVTLWADPVTHRLLVDASSSSITIGGPVIGGTNGLPLYVVAGVVAQPADPGADRIWFWDDSAGTMEWLTVGSGLTITGTTITAAGSGGTVTSVAVSGGTTGLTTSGGPITTSGTITFAGTLALANGGTGAVLVDPNADRIMFWDDSAGQVTWLTAGSGLTITTTTITASGVPGGSNTQVQFNDSGAFGGDSGFVYNKTTNTANIEAIVVGSGAADGVISLSDIAEYDLILKTTYWNPNASIRIGGAVGGDITITPQGVGKTVLTSASGPVVQITSTLNTGIGARAEFYSNSNSPANNDTILEIFTWGNNSIGTKVNYAQIKTIAGDVTSASHSGYFALELTINATGYNMFSVGKGELNGIIVGDSTFSTTCIVQSPTGGDLRLRTGNVGSTFTISDGGGGAITAAMDGATVFNITGGSFQCDAITNDTGLAAGTYTPTRSAETNCGAVTTTEAQYMRVGNTVTVSGRVTGVDPVLAATATSFEITLPVASNIGAVEDCAGVAFCGAISGMGAEITGSVANNTAVISWISSDITSQSWSYTFTYQVI